MEEIREFYHGILIAMSVNTVGIIAVATIAIYQIRKAGNKIFAEMKKQDFQ